MTRISGLVLTSFALASMPLQAGDWIRESKDRGKRTLLHDATQRVRGDSGKWNDHPSLLAAPSIARKPAKLSLDAWADQVLKMKVQPVATENTWLLLRTAQLDDNDRVWVERIERRGQQITIIVNQAKWQGKYFRNFTYYQVDGLNLGKLEPGKYKVACVIQPLTFAKFDGDAKQLDKNWPKDERPAGRKPVELRLTFVVR